jgi:hypothetical protein
MRCEGAVSAVGLSVSDIDCLPSKTAPIISSMAFLMSSTSEQLDKASGSREWDSTGPQYPKPVMQEVTSALCQGSQRLG